MNPTTTDTSDVAPSDSSDPSLEQLLNRADIWRGDARIVAPQLALDSGYAELNAALLNGGWPRCNLVEVCQKGFNQLEWFLLSPALKAADGYIVLLNPPLMPFAQALIQAGIDLDQIIIVQVDNKADFLASFVELARSESCAVLLAWQQQHNLSYTELRKCLLATNEGAALCVMFRPEHAQQQSSPASLRLQSEITANHVQLKIFKQKGVLQQALSQAIKLPVPTLWKALLPYHLLDQTLLPGKSDTSKAGRKSASILPLRRGKR